MDGKARHCVVVFDEMSIKECLQYDVSKARVLGLEDLGPCGRTKHVANQAGVF